MITASIVPAKERPKFYPSICQQYLFFELSIYQLMNQFYEDYHGAYWEFVELSNGGKFSYPEISSSIWLNNPNNYARVELSAQAAGIGVMLIALSCYTFTAYAKGEHSEVERASEAQVLLMEFAMLHPEWPSIATFID
ncbi:antirestriction protein (plasmid) [Vibrio sp. VNB-15]